MVAQKVEWRVIQSVPIGQSSQYIAPIFLLVRLNLLHLRFLLHLELVVGSVTIDPQESTIISIHLNVS